MTPKPDDAKCEECGESIPCSGFHPAVPDDAKEAMTPMDLERAIEIAIDAAGSWQSYGDPNEEPREGVGEAIAVLRAFKEKGLPFYRAAEEHCSDNVRDEHLSYARMIDAYRAMKEGK